ncbi:MAG: repressor LexA [Candidatus Ryanbacteria bacterium RIFCSPLOWO2_01_FULL_48_26]|uniref:Repressor LexA n=1 Tax=Candidatus Ryanbacteria bacterium RIFCSPLOWO2_01_FULL_48_26 TaxID=1802126 RepID=A0A1G2GX68_9BACT|nr:MAG: repressor LexA [Candidatus Ryanbacteria bacterium RIFCSPLOWO2_01_FULL_48_26]
MDNKIKKLTGKQKQFYESLRKLIEKRGESPTVAELVRLMRFSSPRAVTQYLEALEQKGLIERRRYERRGIRLIEDGPVTVNIPIIASAGCDNVSVFAQRNFGDYICVATELLQGKNKDNVACIKAVGDSMVDAGIKEGDYVLVEVTEAVSESDLVVAIIDSFAVIKKIEFANNAVILKPVSSDPHYKPIILNRNFRIFGKVIDVIRVQAKGELEIVPLYASPEEPRLEYKVI